MPMTKIYLKQWKDIGNNKRKVLSGMDDYRTTLKMLPVCSCGYIFRKGVVIHQDINEKDGIKYPTYFIEPSKCPNCNKKIECIERYNDIVEYRERF